MAHHHLQWQSSVRCLGDRVASLIIDDWVDAPSFQRGQNSLCIFRRLPVFLRPLDGYEFGQFYQSRRAVCRVDQAAVSTHR